MTFLRFFENLDKVPEKYHASNIQNLKNCRKCSCSVTKYILPWKKTGSSSFRLQQKMQGFERTQE